MARMKQKKRSADHVIVDGLDTRHHPLYSTWAAIVKRCCNPNNKKFKDYGARGIKMCDRWRESFAAFVADMGPKPTPKHSIDRINNDGNYEPGNCRWATIQEQRANRREPARKLAALLPDGWTRMAKAAGIDHRLVLSRVVRFGWPLERALSVPPEKRFDGSRHRTY